MDIWSALIIVCSQAVTGWGACEPLTAKKEFTSFEGCTAFVRAGIEGLLEQGGFPALPGPWIIRGGCVKEVAVEHLPLPEGGEKSWEDTLHELESQLRHKENTRGDQ